MGKKRGQRKRTQPRERERRVRPRRGLEKALNGPILLLVVVLAGVVVAGYFAWPYLRPVPQVVRPQNLERLDPEVAALIEARVADAAARPRVAQAHGTLGLVYEANLLWEEARASFETAARLAPDEMPWHLHQAIATRQAGDAEGALGLLQALAARHSSSPPVQQRLGEALLEAGDLADAKIAFRRLMALAPEAPQGSIGLGDVLLQQQEAEQAVRVLEQAVAQAPGYRMAHYLLGMAYRSLGRSQDAERALMKGVDATVSYLPDPLTAQVQQYAVNLTARLDRAGAYLDAGQPQQATPILEEALRAHPRDVTVLNALAIAYMRLDRLDDAGALLRTARRRDPEKFSTYINLASLALRADRPEQALAYADTAIVQAPTVDQAHFTRSRVLARLDRLEEALASLHEARQHAPRNPQNHGFSGDLCLRLKRYEDALHHYENALAIDAAFLPAWAGLAQTNWALGRLEDAWTALTEARKLAPDHPMVARLEQQFQLD